MTSALNDAWAGRTTVAKDGPKCGRSMFARGVPISYDQKPLMLLSDKAPGTTICRDPLNITICSWVSAMASIVGLGLVGTALPYSSLVSRLHVFVCLGEVECSKQGGG